MHVRFATLIILSAAEADRRRKEAALEQLNKSTKGPVSIAENPQTRRLTPGWYYLLPEIAAPIGED
jgi:hypothetical protein